MFMSETGTSVGEISGQSKPINSVDFRPTRPFRIVTASEDNTIAVFEGPPFKFKCTKQVRMPYYRFCFNILAFGIASKRYFLGRYIDNFKKYFFSFSWKLFTMLLTNKICGLHLFI